MGILVDFQEAKNKLLNPELSLTSAETPQELSSALKEFAVKRAKVPSDDLVDAIGTFAFSRMPKAQRIAMILAGIFGGEAEQYAAQVPLIDYYASKDFAVPYRHDA
jgi:hypothetical protein